MPTRRKPETQRVCLDAVHPTVVISMLSPRKEEEHLPLPEVQEWVPAGGSPGPLSCAPIEEPARCQGVCLPSWSVSVSRALCGCYGRETESHATSGSRTSTAANASQKTLYLVTSRPVF